MNFRQSCVLSAIFSITLLGLIGISQNVNAQEEIIFDQTSCEIFLGTWNAANSICSIPEALTITSGQTLTISSGITLDIPDYHTLTNMGIVNNYGIISISDIAANECIDDAGRLETRGTLNNYGTIKNSGGTFEMVKTSTFELLNNYGTVENLGVIAILYGGDIINTGSINNNGSFIDCDDVSQNARISISAYLTNSGIIQNSGEIEIYEDGNIFNDCEGVIDGTPITGLKQPTDICNPTESNDNKSSSLDDNESSSLDDNESSSFVESEDLSLDNNDNERSSLVPEWVRFNVDYWANGDIGDKEFFDAIEYLIEEKIILIPTTVSSSGSQEVPSWVKFSAEWWAEGLIPDDGFIHGIEYLVKHRIIQV